MTPGPKPDLEKTEMIRKLLEAGFSYRQIARQLERSVSTIHFLANRGAKLEKSQSLPPLETAKVPFTLKQRTNDMRRLFEKGYTLGAIGYRYGVTKERARQIIHGIKTEKELPFSKAKVQKLMKQIEGVLLK